MEREAEASSFRCPECGAPLAWAPEHEALACAHCGGRVPVDGAPPPPPEPDPVEAARSAPRGLGAGIEASRCRGCGARLDFAGQELARRCPFCGLHAVRRLVEDVGRLRPSAIAPFGVDRKAAEARFRRWLGRRWLAPRALGDEARVDALSGVYVPFWCFDATVEARWRAERGEHVTVDEQPVFGIPEKDMRRPERVRRTRWERAWGHRTGEHDDVLVAGSRALDGKEAALVARGFDAGALAAWDPAYLAGFRAEGYAVELGEAWRRARRTIEADERARCAREVGGDTHRGLVVEMRFSRVAWRLALLPAWVAAYRWHGEVFRFLVDGRTGKVAGRAPWSAWKVGALGLALAALAVVIYVLFLRSS